MPAMPPDEPEFSNWKDAWEWHATQTHDDLRRWPPADLLRAADAGHYDAYYTLWDAIRERCSLADAAPVLLRVIRREAGDQMMLIRYHAAGALFRLLGAPDEPLPDLRQRVMWARGNEEGRLQACDELEALCRARIAAGG
jgi:hypothetical protein